MTISKRYAAHGIDHRQGGVPDHPVTGNAQKSQYEAPEKREHARGHSQVKSERNSAKGALRIAADKKVGQVVLYDCKINP